ncbi:hypothetical protein MKX03_009921 [Papaver bracteatum]|nr:hypothetical protein MKX03_009921 [Papaver bracteatum]
MPFNLFKEEVAKEFGVPVQFQRFWLWAKRQNHTYRPHRPLTLQEETSCWTSLHRNYIPFLPIEQKKIFFVFSNFMMLKKKNFELRYVGRLFVKGSGKPSEILKKLNEMAGFSPDEETELCEEIKFEPTVMCEHIDKKLTFRASQLEDGDIVCFQKPASVVHFRSLEKPEEDDFCLELSKALTYDDVTESVACHIGLDDQTKIRFTPHNCYSQQPKPQAIKYQGVEHLSEMLIHYNQTSDILYYEVLDIPLPELQGLKTLKVAFHHANKEDVSKCITFIIPTMKHVQAMILITTDLICSLMVVNSINRPKQSTVGDLITELKTMVELSHPEVELRLLEVFNHKIYKIFSLSEKIENIDDQYWTLRAEEVPEEEKNMGPKERLIYVYHYTIDASQSQMQVKNFGKPFFLIIPHGETLGQVKLRIQKKLQVPSEEFAKWKFAYLSLGRPEYLQDSDVVSSCFETRDIYGAWEQHLGLEHSEVSWKRAYPTNQQEAAELIGSHSDNAEALIVAQAETIGAGRTVDEVEVSAFGDISPLPNYTTVGQHFLQGEHYQGVLDEKYEDIGGFSILKTQAPLYRQIWLRYGHIATNQVLKNLYATQVTLVTDIMAAVMDMHVSFC